METNEPTIILTPSELEALIINALEKKSAASSSIFNKSQYIHKKKHDLHMSFKETEEVISPHISLYHPMPDKFEFASISRFNGKATLCRLGSKINPHDLARQFALMCFGVSTNRDLSPGDEEEAVAIYKDLVDKFFIHYESHLESKFTKMASIQQERKEKNESYS